MGTFLRYIALSTQEEADVYRQFALRKVTVLPREVQKLCLYVCVGEVSVLTTVSGNTFRRGVMCQKLSKSVGFFHGIIKK